MWRHALSNGSTGMPMLKLPVVKLQLRLRDIFYLDPYEIFVVKGGYIENLKFELLESLVVWFKESVLYKGSRDQLLAWQLTSLLWKDEDLESSLLNTLDSKRLLKLNTLSMAWESIWLQQLMGQFYNLSTWCWSFSSHTWIQVLLFAIVLQ